MSIRTLRIFLLCLLQLTVSCKQFENQANDLSADSVASLVEKDNATTTQGSFKISELRDNGIQVTKGYGSDRYPTFIGRGTIRNLGKHTLNDYALTITYTLYSGSNGSFTLTNPTGNFLDDGFGGGFMDFSGKVKLPWEPNMDIPFEIEDQISVEDLLYPVTKVEVLYQIEASDPFGHVYAEHVVRYDITDSWLAVQRRFKEAPQVAKKKQKTQAPVIEEKFESLFPASAPAPDPDTAARYEQKAKYVP